MDILHAALRGYRCCAYRLGAGPARDLHIAPKPQDTTQLRGREVKVFEVESDDYAKLGSENQGDATNARETTRESSTTGFNSSMATVNSGDNPEKSTEQS